MATKSVTVYVMTPDIDRTRDFYEKALGIGAGARSGNWVPFSIGGATFALHAGTEDVGAYSFSLDVDDIEAAVERFEAAGAKVLRGVADEAFGRMATVQDPDGRTIELVQHE